MINNISLIHTFNNKKHNNSQMINNFRLLLTFIKIKDLNKTISKNNKNNKTNKLISLCIMINS